MTFAFVQPKGFMPIWQSSGTQITTRTVLSFLFDLVSRSFKSVTKHLREGIDSQVQEPPFIRATVVHASTSWSIFLLFIVTHTHTHARAYTHTHTHTHTARARAHTCVHRHTRIRTPFCLWLATVCPVALTSSAVCLHVKSCPTPRYTQCCLK